jgi:hypothetical protein
MDNVDEIVARIEHRCNLRVGDELKVPRAVDILYPVVGTADIEHVSTIDDEENLPHSRL